MFLYLFFTFIVLQRLIELYLAKKNARYIKSIGGYEVGGKHYPLIITLHIFFLTSFLIESLLVNRVSLFWYIAFVVFIIAQGLRLWAIISLGHYWNTRVFIVPHANAVKKGPYRFLRHPNYLVVMVEMITIPLIFSAYFTAIIFPLLNALILYHRIKIEEQALKNLTSYREEMLNTPMFFPKIRKIKENRP